MMFENLEDERIEETVFDIAVHVWGLAYAATCVLALDAGSSRGVRVYVAVQGVMLVCSAQYNALWWSRAGGLLLWMDKVAIVVMIFGTEIAFTLALEEMDLLVWLALATGPCAASVLMVNMFLNWPWPCWEQPAPATAAYGAWNEWMQCVYLLMGSMSVMLVHSLLKQRDSLAWFVFGNAVYLLGVMCYVLSDIPFQRGLWHACVLAGAVMHYTALSVLDPVHEKFEQTSEASSAMKMIFVLNETLKQ